MDEEVVDKGLLPAVGGATSPLSIKSWSRKLASAFMQGIKASRKFF
jgi:hypothetical protein